MLQYESEPVTSSGLAVRGVVPRTVVVTDNGLGGEPARLLGLEHRSVLELLLHLHLVLPEHQLLASTGGDQGRLRVRLSQGSVGLTGHLLQEGVRVLGHVQAHGMSSISCNTNRFHQSAILFQEYHPL